MTDDMNIMIAGLVIGACGLLGAAWLGLMVRVFTLAAGWG